MNAIEITDLKKNYGSLQALRGVNLVVPKGAIYGLVGPNGAGKSTLIKALVGALRPSAGRITVMGLDPLQHRWELRQQIGYMPQSAALYEDLSPRQNIAFFGQGHSLGENLAQKIAEILEFTELTGRSDDPLYTFSGGMKKRVSLACALIHQPSILFLDEPTAAVDPHLKLRSWRLFRLLAGQGTTLFISTHLMDESLLCDQVAILHQGKIIAVDPPQKILQNGKARLRLQRGDQTESLETEASPTALAKALHPFGLSSEIEAVYWDCDSLEAIVLSWIRQEDQNS